jgi:hypothetical protein
LPFSQFGLHSDLLRGVREMGYTRPTPIQQDAIPPAVEGRDVLACAMTGSGKTAAFVLPTLHRLLGKTRGVTRVLVLTPTRELAAQIEENTRALGAHTHLKSAAVFGGVAMGPQEHAFRTGVDVLVATPGRLLDHFRMPYAKLPGIEGRRARIKYHEQQREGFTNVYLDAVEPLPGDEPDEAEEHANEVAWRTAIEAAPYILSGDAVEREVPPEEFFEKLKPLKDLVAEDIRPDEPDV